MDKMDSNPGIQFNWAYLIALVAAVILIRQWLKSQERLTQLEAKSRMGDFEQHWASEMSFNDSEAAELGAPVYATPLPPAPSWLNSTPMNAPYFSVPYGAPQLPFYGQTVAAPSEGQLDQIIQAALQQGRLSVQSCGRKALAMGQSQYRNCRFLTAAGQRANFNEALQYIGVTAPFPI